MPLEDNTTPPSDFNNAMPTGIPASIPTEFNQPSNQVESTSPISHIDSNTPLDLGDTSFEEPEYAEVANPPLVPEPLQTETIDNTFQEPVQTEIINPTFEEPIQTENTPDTETIITPEQEKLNSEFASFMKEHFPEAFMNADSGAYPIYTASAGEYIDSKAFASFEMQNNAFSISSTKADLFRAFQNVRKYPDAVESTDMKEIIRNLLSFEGSIIFSKNGLHFTDGSTSMLRPESLKGFKKDEVDKLFEALNEIGRAHV